MLPQITIEAIFMSLLSRFHASAAGIAFSSAKVYHGSVDSLNQSFE